MFRANRREFLASVGQGMFVATVGYHTALDLGLARAASDDAAATLDFGQLEPLVDLMQSTEADKLLPILVERIRKGESLRTLVAAGALANARAFGGEDYVGFHTLMALAPAYSMSQRLPADRAPLPVLKVLYRNAKRLQEKGGAEAHTLRPVLPALGEGDATARLRDAVHRRDLQAAEPLMAALAARSPEEAFDVLLPIVGEAPEVHRVVLAHRAWDMLDLVGAEQAATMLRQSVRYCIKNEEYSAREHMDVRTLLPKLLDAHKLNEGARGDRAADDAWVDQTSQLIFTSTPETAADAVAAALAEGMSPESVAEALSLAANQLVLRDSGRPAGQTQPNKPLGSVHGDSIGVHACDSAHAWRSIARVGSPRNRASALILGAWQAAYDRTSRGGDFLAWDPRPHAEQLGKVADQDGATLLADLDRAVREQDQALACAVAHRYAAQGYEAQPAFDVLLRFATSEDGALHAEKFYRTTSDEYAATRPAFRGRQLVALARVTASEFGQPAPGYAEACGLLGVPA
jgi:hypothetical protein